MCTLCITLSLLTGTIGNGNTLLLECPECKEVVTSGLAYSQGLGCRNSHGRKMVSVAKFINECLDKFYAHAAGPSRDDRACDQLDVAGREVI